MIFWGEKLVPAGASCEGLPLIQHDSTMINGDLHGISMGFLWDLYGISMGSIWDFYVIYVGFI